LCTEIAIPTPFPRSSLLLTTLRADAKVLTAVTAYSSSNTSPEVDKILSSSYMVYELLVESKIMSANADS